MPGRQVHVRCYGYVHCPSHPVDDSHVAGGSHADLSAHAAAPRRRGAVHSGLGESSEVNKQALEQIRQDLGLDQPLIVQYGRWLWGAVQLDFGNSYWTRQPVTEELKRRYPITANLAVMSLLLGTLIAIPVGVLSAVRQDTLADYAAGCLSSLACPCPISGSPFSSF